MRINILLLRSDRQRLLEPPLSKLKAHMLQICGESDTYACPGADCPPPTVRYEGRCTEGRCVRVEVPLKSNTP